MNCPNCGTSNLDNASICVNCGRPMGAAAPPRPPVPPPQTASYTPPPPPRTVPYGGTPSALIPNYLWQSIVVTLCCCLPLGIVAIIFSAQVNQKLAAGDVAGAEEASRNAKKWCWIALIAGIIGYILGLLINGAAIYSTIMANR